MATATIHQWKDTDRGLRELRRVSRGSVVILTFVGEALAEFWLAEYVPVVRAARGAAGLGGAAVAVGVGHRPSRG